MFNKPVFRALTEESRFSEADTIDGLMTILYFLIFLNPRVTLYFFACYWVINLKKSFQCLLTGKMM